MTIRMFGHCLLTLVISIVLLSFALNTCYTMFLVPTSLFEKERLLLVLGLLTYKGFQKQQYALWETFFERLRAEGKQPEPAVHKPPAEPVRAGGAPRNTEDEVVAKNIAVNLVAPNPAAAADVNDDVVEPVLAPGQRLHPEVLPNYQSLNRQPEQQVYQDGGVQQQQQPDIPQQQLQPQQQQYQPPAQQPVDSPLNVVAAQNVEPVVGTDALRIAEAAKEFGYLTRKTPKQYQPPAQQPVDSPLNGVAAQNVAPVLSDDEQRFADAEKEFGYGTHKTRKLNGFSADDTGFLPWEKAGVFDKLQEVRAIRGVYVHVLVKYL